MDLDVGLEYIVDNKEYTQKLAVALDTPNVTAKKQVFEILSALCVYNSDGYQRVLETLEEFKNNKTQRYRFKFLVDELKEAKNVDYQIALMAFVNCLIISSPSLKERVRVRNEFIGLKLLDIIGQLRRECADNADSDLAVQLDVFDQQKYTDEGQLTGPAGVDLNSHLDVFYAILRQVAETPQEIPFLNILQHLLRVDYSLPISDIIWDTAETLVHRATLLETKEDSEKLLRSPSYHHNLNKLRLAEIKCQCSCHKTEDSEGRTRRRTLVQLNFGDGTRTPSVLSPTGSVSHIDTSSTRSMISSPPPPPPPLPPICSPTSSVAPPMCSPTSSSVAPLPPPPPSSLPPPPPPPPPPLGGAPPPPPPPPPLGLTPSPAPLLSANAKLPQQITPKPKSKMKTLNWNKIPAQKIVGKTNLWTLVAKTHTGSPNDMDFVTMEGLFCQQANLGNGQSSPRLGGREPGDYVERKKRESLEITLLDGKRSLNINIFLKQFRSSNEEIIRILKEGRHSDIGAERLRGLLKIQPESDEVELLRGFNGDRSKLGTAEGFLLQLVELSSYKLRIEGMLLKEEFASNMAFLEPAIETITSAAHEIMESEKLHEILYMVLVAGNFLNSGGYAGNAAGFKTMSLLKLTDIRANKPGMNLVHYVAVEAEKKGNELLQFTEEMINLEEAAKLSIDNLKSEATNLSQRVSKISQQVVSAEDEIKEQMEDFLKFAESGVVCVMREIENLNITRKELAEFLCEDYEAFKLEDCFKVFHSFCQKFKMAVQDNERRKQQEKRAQERRRQKEEQELLKRRSYSGPDAKDNSDHIVDMLLGDIRSGFSRMGDNYRSRRGRGGDISRMNSQTSSLPSEDECAGSPRILRRRIGSLGSIPGNGEGLDADSPDTTPNGSMRRRRSRLSSDEQDDSLLDFLRQGSELEARDRRSWGSYDGGSLDRSWLRRSGRRRRQDLLTADLNERERPASPISPMMDKCVELPEPEPKPRPWRSKIEDWLTENEKEQEKERKLKEKLNAERKRRKEFELKEMENSLQSEREGLETLHESRASDESPLPRTERHTNCQDEVTKEVPMRDKSKWRKSNLNVANSSEFSSANPSNVGSSFVHLPSMKNESSETPLSSDKADLQEKHNDKYRPNVIEMNTPVKPEPTVTVNGHWYPEITKSNVLHLNDAPDTTPNPMIRGARKYHSMRESPWRAKGNENFSDTSSYNGNIKGKIIENSGVPSVENNKQYSILEERGINKDDKNICDDTEKEMDSMLKFERFSPMRRTTRRPRIKEQEIAPKNIPPELSHDKVEFNERTWLRNEPEHPLSKIKSSKSPEFDYIEGAIENINKASREIQELDKINRGDNPCDNIEGKRQLIPSKPHYLKRLNSLTGNPNSKKEVEIPTSNSTHPLMNGDRYSNSNFNRQKKTFADTVPEERVFRSTLELTPMSPSCENRTLLPILQNEYSKKQCVDSPVVKSNRVHSENNFPSDVGKKVISHLADNKEESKGAKMVSSLEIPTKLVTSHAVALRQRTSDEPDEGFEESQSQLSETASQAASGAFDTDLIDGSPRIQREKKGLSDAITDKLNSTSSQTRSEINELKPSGIPQSKVSPKRPSSLGIPVLNRSLSVTDRTRRPNFSRAPLRSTSVEKVQPSAGQVSRRQRGLVHRTASTDSQNSAQGLGKRSRSSSRTSLRGSTNSISSGTSRSRNGGIGNKDSTRRIAAYTEDLRSRTRNLRKRGLERYDTTQSVPSTPSEETKHIASSSHSENKYSPSGSRVPSRASSVRSLSRRSSDGSITLSRQDLLKKAVRSSQANGNRPISSIRKPISSRTMKREPAVASYNKRTLSRMESHSPSNSNRIDLKNCNFMRATSSSTAKTSMGKMPDSSAANQRLRTKPSPGQSPIRTWPVKSATRLLRN